MAKKSKRVGKPEKLLVYPDGTQRVATIGLVDSHGFFCTMQDTSEPVYMGYSGESQLIAELEDEKERSDKLIVELDGKLIGMEELVRDMAIHLPDGVRAIMLGRMDKILN